MTYPELADQPLSTTLSQLADANPTPGGGAAAAATGAMAAALLEMVAATTLRRKRYEAGWPAAEAAQGRLPTIREALTLAISEDAVVYRNVVVLLSHQTEANTTTALQALEDALTAAAQVPQKVARLSAELVEIGVGLVAQGNVHAAADAAAACQLAAAAVRSSATNLHVNLRDVSNDKLKTSWINEARRLVARVEEQTAGLHEQVLGRLAEQGRASGGRKRKRRS